MLKQAVGFGVFYTVRTLDRLLPVEALRWILLPWAGARALLPTNSLRWTRDWPRCLGPDRRNRFRSWSQSLRHHLDRVPAFLPDRLGLPRWRERFEITGLGPLESARAAGRPVVLAFCHFGPIVLISHCLRAQGIPAIPLVAGVARNRPYIHRLKDRHLPFPEIPGALYTDQLREVASLGARAVLLVAVDVRAGRTVDVPLTDGWQFRLATGAIRMAAQKRAVLIPCTQLSLGSWRFRIELGRPVPEASLGPVPDVSRAAAHLVSELFPALQAHPDHCGREVFGSLLQNPPSPADPDSPTASDVRSKPTVDAIPGTRPLVSFETRSHQKP
ncbi:MAG: hypothetical protein JNL10_17165 [Verrucomicrobiales bacterium]|nr:hypothetical protein [Verrucomicrobiales bacterium]